MSAAVPPATGASPLPDRVRAVIAACLDFGAVRWDDRSDLRCDLGADSLDMIELGIACEEEFGVQITEEDVDGWRRVADVVGTVERAIARVWP